MVLNLNIEGMKRQLLTVPKEKEDKGWSYSYVYYLRDLKDIYQIYYQNECVTNVPALLKYCRLNKIQSESGREWHYRNLLELVNALKNFGLFDIKTNLPQRGQLFNSGINENLTNTDLEVMKNIYFTYFRFTQYLPIFNSPSYDDKPIAFAYMENSRFYNRFVRPDISTIFEIDAIHEDMMRFWEVFTKWGTSLNVLNKNSVQGFDVEIANEDLANSILVQLTKQMQPEFSIIDFMENNFSEECVYIPHLIWKIINLKGFAIEDIKSRLVFECSQRNREYRLQRVTEIFIEYGEKNLYPFHDGSYMSHILKLK